MISLEVFHPSVIEQNYTVDTFDVLQLMSRENSRLSSQVTLNTLLEEMLTDVRVNLQVFYALIEACRYIEYSPNTYWQLSR